MNFLFRRYFESKILLLRDSWIFLWRDFSKGENLFILSNFEYIYIYTKIFELHEFRIEDLFVSFLPSDFRIFFLDYHDKDISLWIFFSEDSSFSFYKQDVGTACISYYSFDSMHLESRTWIYIGNVSNTRVQLCSGKIWIFFFFFRLHAFDMNFCVTEEDKEKEEYDLYRRVSEFQHWTVNGERYLYRCCILKFCSAQLFTLWSRRKINRQSSIPYFFTKYNLTPLFFYLNQVILILLAIWYDSSV